MSILKLRLPLSLLLTVSLLAGCASAPQKPQGLALGDYSYAKEYLSWLIRKEMRSEDVTGLTIAVVDDQHLLWAEGFGYSDLEQKIAATPETQFQLGSISKLFTATAVMQLADAGRIDIDQPLQHYLPEFSVRSRFAPTTAITSRNLLTHHSGLPANLLKGMSVRDPEPFTHVVDALHNEYVAYPPNKLFNYSNVGYSLLGTLVERVSGEEYTSYMQHHLLQPMGMVHTSFSQHTSAKSYNNNKEIPVLPLRDIPASGLNSNALDMARFMRTVLAGGQTEQGSILDSATLARMMQPQNQHVALDLDFQMGFGWMLGGIDVSNAGVIAAHGGTTLNFQSMLVVLPEQHLGVVVLSNTASSHMMVNRVATAALQQFLEAKSGITQPPKRAIELDDKPLTPQMIEAYSGYYDTMAGLVKVYGSGGGLTAEALGKEFKLAPRKDGMFSLEYKLFGLIPIHIDTLSDIGLYLTKVDGQQILAGNINGQSTLFGEKLPVAAPLSAEMLHYVGDYEFVDDVGGTKPSRMSIVQEGGRLVGEFALDEVPGFVFRIAFQPVSADELIVAGLGGGRGETARLLKLGSERRIRYSGAELRLKGNAGSGEVVTAEQQHAPAPAKNDRM